MTTAYNKIDRILREKLSDDDYSTYKEELEAICQAKIQRTWVGLFDDEIMQIWGGIIKYAPSEVRIKYFARAIESKLKEVNR